MLIKCRLVTLSANGKRIGEVADIVPLVAFLASDDAQWITGQSLGANGGMA